MILEMAKPAHVNIGFLEKVSYKILIIAQFNCAEMNWHLRLIRIYFYL